MGRLAARLAIAGAVLAGLAVLAGCGRPKTGDRPMTEAGLVKGYSAVLVQSHLNNPSCVSFSPRGELTVVDSGNGAVYLWTQANRRCPVPLVSGFDTEHWKVDAKTGTKRFKLGPLSAVWVSDQVLAVTDGGRPDGQETVNFYRIGRKAGSVVPLAAAEATRSNAVPPTSKDKADKGEGNLTGMSLSSDGSMLYVCGQGSDAKTWVLSCGVRGRKLKPLLSADDNGIAVNSPMQCLYRKPGWLLVLYSGDGGKADGLIVEWDLASGKPVNRWKLPGLIDPMGMDFIPGKKGELAVVDNNWALTKVNPGKLARVKLPPGKSEAEVTVIGTGLKGPVSCAFGPDGKLYVAQLGEMFDRDLGTVIAIDGFQ
jgi:WD40 repeat protein